MFTGIIEETGIVKKFSKETYGANITIKCSKVLENTQIGDSIAINGVCQTVTKLNSDSFCANISEETLNITTFSSIKSGDIVNLERALTLNSRLGGHIVTGHVDTKGKFLSCKQLAEFYNLTFEIPHNHEKYAVYKGSITINGVSLTIAKIEGNIITAAIIPHTYNNTNLKNLKTGDFVNIETDILGKYIEKILSAKDNNNKISMNFLEENGFV